MIVDDVKGVEFHCACGHTAIVRVDDGELICDTTSPNIVIGLVEKADDGGEPFTTWLVHEDVDAA